MTMRKLLAVLATLAMLCTVLPLSALFTATAADGSNLIANGEFTDGIAGWYASGGTVIEAADGTLHGDYNENWGFIGYDITLEPNTDYVLTFDAKSINAGGVTAKLNKTDWTGTVQSFPCDFGADWQTFTWEFNSGSYGPMWLYFQSGCEATANQEIWLDNVSLVKAEGGDTPVTPDAPVDGNLIVNGDFETGDNSGWEIWQSTSISADAAKDGAFGAHLVGNGGWGGMLNQTVSVEAGKEYKLSFWINVNAMGVNVQVKNGAGANIEGAGGWFDGNKKDTKVEWVFTATDDKVLINFCGSGAAPEDVYVDNFSLVATGNAAPVEPSNDGYIINGDFETGDIAPWDNLWGSCPKAEIIEGGKDSKYALNVVSGQWKHVRQTGIAVEANTNYKVTAWAKDASNMCLLVKDGGDSKDIVNAGVNAGSEWTQFTAEFNSGEYTSIIFSLMGGDVTAYGVFDNIVIEKIGGGETPDTPDEPDEPVTPPAGGLLNATFDSGEFDGILSSSDISVADGELQFTVSKDWGNIYAELAVEANTDYKVSFRAKAKLSKNAWVKFHKADWTGDICQNDVALSTSWKEYSYTMNSGDNTSLWLLVQYAGYAGEGEVIWFDYITVEKIGGGSTPDTPVVPDVPVDSALINGSFENGSEGWELGSSASITDEDAKDGSYSLRLENPGMWAAAAVQNVAVKPNTDYVIEMWTKRIKLAGALNLFMMDAADNRNLTVVEGQNWFNTQDKDWTKHTIVINTGAATEIVIKWSAEGANAGIMLIDDMTIAEKNAPPAPSVGLITNGDFETGDNTGWEKWQSTVISEEAAHSGKYGANLIGNGGWGGLLNQSFKAEVGETYTITLWACVNGGGVNLQIKGADKVEGECDNTYLDPNELNAGWTLRTFNVVANSDEITLNFCGANTGKSEDVYIDEIVVVKKGETPPVDETSPIKNAGFETGDLTGWNNLWNSCVYSFDTPGHDKSNYALNFESPGQWNQIRQDKVPVTPNTDYTVVGYVKNPFNVNIVVKTGNDSANIADFGIENDMTNQWIRVEIPFNSGAETEVCVLLIGREAGATAVFDNVQIYLKGEEPAEPEPDAPATEGPTSLNSFGVAVNRPATPEANLILNGSFENAEGGQWQSILGDTLYVVDDETAPEGNKSLFFNTSGVTENNKIIFYLDVEPNTDYVFSAWVKGAFISDTNRFNATIGTIDWKDNFMVYADDLFSTKQRQIVPPCWDNEWHLRSVGFNSGINTKVGIGFAGAESQMWIDDIALYTVDNGVKYMSPVQSSGIVPSTVLREEGYCDEKDNLIPDMNMDDAESKEFWSAAMGYQNGFISFSENKYEYGTSMKYTGSEDSCNTHMINWIDVKPNTDYTFSVDIRVVHDGGKLVLLDGKKRDCQPFVMIDFDKISYGEDWFTVAVHFDSSEFDRIGIAVVDGGGVALIDNMRLFETANRIDAEKVEFVKPPYAYGSAKDPHFIPGFGGDEPGIGGGDSPDTGVSVVGAALAMALVPASAAVAFKLRRKKEDEE